MSSDVTHREGHLVFSYVASLLQDMTADWERDDDQEIGPETRLVGDLGFESIDMIEFIVALEERYRRRDLPFEQMLMRNGRYVDELRVQEVVDFLCKHLGSGAPASAAT